MCISRSVNFQFLRRAVTSFQPRKHKVNTGIGRYSDGRYFDKRQQKTDLATLTGLKIHNGDKRVRLGNCRMDGAV